MRTITLEFTSFKMIMLLRIYCLKTCLFSEILEVHEPNHLSVYLKEEDTEIRGNEIYCYYKHKHYWFIFYLISVITLVNIGFKLNCIKNMLKVGKPVFRIHIILIWIRIRIRGSASVMMDPDPDPDRR